MSTKLLLSVQMAAAGVMTSSAYAQTAKPHAEPKSGHFEARMVGKVAVK